MRHSLVFPILITLACLVPTAGAAERASIRGRIVDPSGEGVPGATVSARSASGTSRPCAVDRDGRYECLDLPAGRFEIVATADGFSAPAVAVTLRDGEAATADVPLRMAAVTDSVVVSASFVELPRSESAVGVTAFSRAALEERQIATVADALRLVPGMTVAATGGAGSVTSVFPRGGESDYTLVLVDGIRMNAFGGGFDFGHLTTAGLGQIEVVRGPQSAVFGSDAIGGVVQLRSRVGGRPALTGLVEAGGYGTTRLAAGTTGTVGRIAWGVSADRVHSDGWTDVAPGTTTPVTNDDYDASVVAGSADVRVNPRATLRFDGRYGTNERGNPGPFGSDPIGAFTGIDRVSRGTNRTGAGAAAFTYDVTPSLTMRARSDYTDQRSTFVSPWGESLSRSRRWTGQAQIERAINAAISATAGAAWLTERADSTYITGGTGGMIPVSRSNGSLFGEVRVRPGARVFVTAGVRAERIVREALDADSLAWEPRPAFAADRLWSVNPRAAVNWFVHQASAAGSGWTRLHASAGTGIRPPDALEIAYTDNPGLKPERSRSVDAGVEQAFAGGRLVADATAFVNRYDDLIVAIGRAMMDLSRFRTDNIANARARGLETSLSVRAARGVDITLNYTFLETAVLGVDGSRDVAPAPFKPGDALLRRPRHQASVDVVWRRGAATAFVRAGARSQALDVEPNWGASGGLFQAPGFAVADAGLAWRLSRQFDLVGRVENLFDRRYETVLGYPAPRRTFTVGVRIAASR
jgi:outer membrane cobalamin receptor